MRLLCLRCQVPINITSITPMQNIVGSPSATLQVGATQLGKKGSDDASTMQSTVAKRLAPLTEKEGGPQEGSGTAARQSQQQFAKDAKHILS